MKSGLHGHGYHLAGAASSAPSFSPAVTAGKALSVFYGEGFIRTTGV
jgi:hypothetical protein